MTISELIKKLEEYPGDTEVMVTNGNCHGCRSGSVEYFYSYQDETIDMKSKYLYLGVSEDDY